MSREPVRLADLAKDASSEQEFMRDVIRAERTELPTDTKMQELATRLGPIVATRASGTAVSAWKWLALAALAGAFAVGAISLRWSADVKDAPSAAPRPSSPAAPVVSPSSPAPTLQPSAPGIHVDSLPTVSALPANRPAPSAATPACTSEIELVDHAEAALRSGDAKSALALTREHGERCPNGAFVQERERIAIEALARLGQHGEVRARARAFETRFPSSPHIRRIRSLVETDSE